MPNFPHSTDLLASLISSTKSEMNVLFSKQKLTFSWLNALISSYSNSNNKYLYLNNGRLFMFTRNMIEFILETDRIWKYCTLFMSAYTIYSFNRSLVWKCLHNTVKPRSNLKHCSRWNNHSFDLTFKLPTIVFIQFISSIWRFDVF